MDNTIPGIWIHSDDPQMPSKEAIDKLVEEALDSMCAHVQSSIGQRYGDNASMFWSGDDERELIYRYVYYEIYSRISEIKHAQEQETKQRG